MIIVHNTKKDILYLLTNKNGSSLLYDFLESGRYSELVQYNNLNDCLEILGVKAKEIKIIITYRDPIVRFKSGLSTIAHNLNANQLKEWQKTIRIKVLMKNLDCFGPSFAMEDPHCEHVLWLPIMLMSYNYNVEMVPMSAYSDHLLKLYPNCNDLILRRERKKSFKIANNYSEMVWDLYKQCLETPWNPHINFKEQWDDWMAPEILIFNTLHKKKKLSETEATELLSILIESGYFSNICSLNWWNWDGFYEIHRALEERNGIHTHKNLRNMFKCYENIKNNLQKFPDL